MSAPAFLPPGVEPAYLEALQPIARFRPPSPKRSGVWQTEPTDTGRPHGRRLRAVGGSHHGLRHPRTMRAGVHEHWDLQFPVGSQPDGAGCPTGLTRRLPCDPSSVGAARRALDELGAWLQPTLLADLRLLVSELVANSVEHGPRREGRAIRLGVSISNERVRAEVQDGGRGFIPMASRPPLEAASGRGLYLVDQLAACWGVTSAGGTRVWFELDRERFEAEIGPQASDPLGALPLHATASA